MSSRSRVGGTPEAVEDGVNGYLVEPGDVNQLADRLSRLLANSDLRTEMGKRNRRRVEQGFDWDDLALRTLTVYRDALGVAVSKEAAKAWSEAA